MQTNVENIRSILYNLFLWVDYGRIEQVYDAGDITTTSLYTLQAAVNAAIREREKEDV